MALSLRMVHYRQRMMPGLDDFDQHMANQQGCRNLVEEQSGSKFQ